MPEPLKEHSKEPKQSDSLTGPVTVIFDSADTGSWRIFRPRYEHWECFQCLTCQWYCPVDAISAHEPGENFIEINLDYCKGCGICANVCSRQCIRMVPE